MKSNKEPTPQQTIFKSCQGLGTVVADLTKVAAEATTTLPLDVAREMRRISMDILILHGELARIYREGLKPGPSGETQFYAELTRISREGSK